MTAKFSFKGSGSIDRGRKWRLLDPIDLAPFDDPAGYQLFDDDLVEAVNTAISLGMPLLLTGEPGVGKTALAGRIAAELNCECLMFRVKSTSEGTDVLYQIDHLGRMAEANARSMSALHEEGALVKPGSADILDYVQFNALGKAILRTWPTETLKEHGLYHKAWPDTQQASAYTEDFGSPSPSVVLIDEIDKAPSDVPNDLLEEIRTLSFELPYVGDSLKKIGIGGPADQITANSAERRRLRPVIIITSNSERSLPPAFLRRCAYYHMRLPENLAGQTFDNKQAEEQAKERYEHFRAVLEHRVNLALGGDPSDTLPENLIKIGWEYFWCLRKASLERKPSTAELLNWMTRLCDETQQSELQQDKEKRISLACQLLVKQKDEVERARAALQQLES